MSHRHNLRSKNKTDVIVAAKVAVPEAEPVVVTEVSKEDKEILIGSEEFYKIKRAHMEKLHKDLCKIGWGDKLEYVTKKFDKKDPYAFGERWVGKNERGNCFLAALARNISRINPKKGKAELKRICFRGKCPECESELTATVQDLLEQEDYGCDYEMGSEGGALKCTNCCVKCQGYSKAKMKKCKHDPDGFQGWYVTGMCHGEFGMNCGKFVNHCTECPGLGDCVDDKCHCNKCGKHCYGGCGGWDHLDEAKGEFFFDYTYRRPNRYV